MKNAIIILVIIIVVAGVAIAAREYFQPQTEPTVEKTTEPTQEETAEPVIDETLDFVAETKIYYPNGGERLSIEEEITIDFVIAKGVIDSFSDKMVAEIYLLRSDNKIRGFIGKVNQLDTSLKWIPKNLYHSGGLDMPRRAPPAGEYKLLLLVRKKAERLHLASAPPVDILTDPYHQYQDGNLFYLGDPSGIELITSDVSDGLFEIYCVDECPAF
jgi:hypothetical protein